MSKSVIYGLFLLLCSTPLHGMLSRKATKPLPAVLSLNATNGSQINTGIGQKKFSEDRFNQAECESNCERLYGPGTLASLAMGNYLASVFLIASINECKKTCREKATKK